VPSLKNWRRISFESGTQLSLSTTTLYLKVSFPIADLSSSFILRSVLTIRDGAPAVAIVNPDAVTIGRRLKERFALVHIDLHFDIRILVDGTRKNLLSRLSLSESS
jgi:hypothetical protein